MLAVLREAGSDGLTAEEIAAHVLAARALDPKDATYWAPVRRGVTGCLRRRKRTGLIEVAPGQDGGAVRWRGERREGSLVAKVEYGPQSMGWRVGV